MAGKKLNEPIFICVYLCPSVDKKFNTIINNPAT